MTRHQKPNQEPVITGGVPHPGELLWAEWLDPLDITVNRAATALGVTRKTLSAILNGRQGISPVMSIRLGRALNVPEDAWLLKQVAYDLSTVNRRGITVRRIVPDGYDGTADMTDDPTGTVAPEPTPTTRPTTTKRADALQPGDVVVRLPYRGQERLPITTIAVEPDRIDHRGLALLGTDADGDTVQTFLGHPANQVKVRS